MPTGMNGISLAGNNRMCEIRFDTTKYSSNKRLIRKAKRKIHKKGINIKLDTKAFADGLLILIIGTVVDTTYAIRDFILYVLELIARSKL